MRKSLVAIVAITSLAFISACGTSGGSSNGESSSKDADSDKTTTTVAETTTTVADDSIPVDEWAKAFCGNFSTWLDDIKSASSGVSAQVTPGDIESAKTAIAGLFDSASQSTQTLIDELDQGGDPDIENGDELVDDLIAKFQGFDDAAQKAKADTEALATDDPTTFQSDADALTSTFQDEVGKIGDSFSEIDAKYPSTELNDALNSSCTF